MADLGHVGLHWEERGSGAPVVLSGSLGSDMRVWGALAPRLPGRVIRYDMRGHGLSGMPPGPWSVEALAADAAALIERLDAGPCAFVGLSIGGLIGLRLALDRPDLVSRLALVGSAARIGAPEVWRDRAASVSAGGMAATLDGAFERWFAPDRRDRPEALACRVMWLAQRPEGHVAACAALKCADLRDRLGALRLPVLGIAGEHDGTCPPDAVRETALAVPGGRFAVIEGAGHLPPVDAPDALAALLVPFLAGEPRDGRQVRAEVLGEAHVARAEAATTAFDAPFQALIARHAWGDVWGSDAIPRRERSMLTLAILAALGCEEEVAMHVRAAARTGASRSDIAQAFLHVAVYAGVPRANRAFAVAKAALAERDEAAAAPQTEEVGR